MTSWLIDTLLVAALLATAWRVGGLYRELRHLRSAEAGFRTALAEADASINRAAHAVVLLKSEGVRTLRALEAQVGEARELEERLEAILEGYERARALASVAGNDDRSRLASVTATIR